MGWDGMGWGGVGGEGERSEVAVARGDKLGHFLGPWMQL